MKASTDRILTTHVGSMPRPESIKSLLRARLAGETVDDAQLAARAADAVAEAVRQQARASGHRADGIPRTFLSLITIFGRKE